MIAKLIGEPSRAQILIALLSGRAMTATELAHIANISPQTASSHLSQLAQGGLLSLEKQGRHRYYRLANAEVATALEALMSITPIEDMTTQTLEPIYIARSCYDHVAGRVGVLLADTLQDRDWLIPDGKDFKITAKGNKEFAHFGIDLTSLEKQRRHLARQCLDWSERRHHIAGALGAALLTQLLERKWLRKDKASRVLYLTQEGYRGFEKAFDMRI